jgi:hypothetical protein
VASRVCLISEEPGYIIVKPEQKVVTDGACPVYQFRSTKHSIKVVTVKYQQFFTLGSFLDRGSAYVQAAENLPGM